MKRKLIWSSAFFMSFLIVMLPVCFADSISLTYDNNGNLVTGDGFYREYNTLNQLWKVRNGSDVSGNLLEEYTFHPVEERVLIKKVYYTNTSLKETIYYVSDEFVRVINTSGTYDFTYVKHEGTRVAELRPDDSKYFIHADHLGSTTLLTDSNGNALENSSYMPFGEIIDGGEVSRFDYEGMEYDDVIGQYDFRFRGYKSSWGKFTQPDNLIQNVYDPQTLNRYAFERNNAWKNVDPTGHYFFLFVGVILLAIAVVKMSGAKEKGDMEAYQEIQEKALIDQVTGLIGIPLGKIGTALSYILPAIFRDKDKNPPEPEDPLKGKEPEPPNPQDDSTNTDGADALPTDQSDATKVDLSMDIAMNTQSVAIQSAAQSMNAFISSSGGGGSSRTYGQWKSTSSGSRAYRNYVTSVMSSLVSRGWSPGGR